MSWLETIRTGLDAVRTHRLRSGLTVLGILIGIAAVILTVGLGEGAQNQVTSEINALGTNLLTITPGSTTSTTGIREAFGLGVDADRGRRHRPVLHGRRPGHQGGRPASPRSSEALTRRHAELDDHRVRARRRRGSPSVAARSPRAASSTTRTSPTTPRSPCSGPTTASELFSREDPVGQTVDVERRAADRHRRAHLRRVVDLVVEHDRPGRPGDRPHHAPAPSGIFGGTSATRSAPSPSRPRRRPPVRRLPGGRPPSCWRCTTSPTAADADFTITSQASLLSTATSVDHTLTILLGGIAAISLLVGRHRRHEHHVGVGHRAHPGDRPAQGARRHAPASSAASSSSRRPSSAWSAGCLGVVAGLARRHLAARAIGDPISSSPTAAVGALVIAMAIGVLFGVYPASRAATLAPIDALRSE